MSKFPGTIILDNIRSAYNVGSVLRTAACAGLHSVISAGYTAPADHPRVAKTSLGSTQMLHTQSEPDLASLYQKLTKKQAQTDNIEIFVLETIQTAKSLWEIEFNPESSSYFIFGNEVDGVRLDLIADNIPEARYVQIPMPGPKQSINVSSASSIVIYEYIRQLTK